MKKYTLFMLIAFLMGIMSCAGPAKQTDSTKPAGRYYVKTDGNDEASGNSWEAAFATLQKALESAKPDYEIWVAAGTYTPTRNAADGSVGDGGSHNAFVLRDGVTIYGGFPNTGNPGMDDRNWEANSTILSGDLGNNNKTYHVIVAIGVSDKTRLDGFTITGGYAHSYSDNDKDILVNGQEVEKHHGGGMYNVSSSPVLTNLIFRENHADYGGGICNKEGSSPILTNVIVKENSAMHGGGGIHNSSSSPIFTDVIISENVTAGYGGGIFNEYESSPILTNVTISKNSVTFRGGGIYNYESSPMLTNVTISENDAPDGGGGINNENRSNPVLTNVIISGNDAGHSGGGGISNNDSSSPILINVLISGNVANGGGGMANSSSSPILINVTIAGNKAENKKYGAVSNYNSSPSFFNTIIVGNNSGIVDDGESIPIYNHCMVQGIAASRLNNSGSGNLDAGSVFVAPANPAAAPTTSGDYRLSGKSPAINKGNNNYNKTATDLDGK